MFSGHLSQSSAHFIALSSYLVVVIWSFCFLHIFSMNGLRVRYMAIQIFLTNSQYVFFCFLTRKCKFMWVWPKSSPFTFWLSIEFKCVLFSGTNSLYLYMNQDHHSVSSTLEIFQCVLQTYVVVQWGSILCNQSLAKKNLDLNAMCYRSFLRAALSFFCTLDKYYKKVPNYPTTKKLFSESLVKLLVNELCIYQDHKQKLSQNHHYEY